MSDVSRETRERLEVYVAEVLKWNRRVNLISKADEPAIWPRHIDDALQLVPFIPAGATRAIDLGSGAGIPGLILAIATGIEFDLIEADQRKAAFLREAARLTGAPVRIYPQRIEAAFLVPAPVVTARALAPLCTLVDLAAPLIAPAGIALFPKGESVDAELTGAQCKWNMRVERFPSRTHPRGVILRLSEVERA